MTERMPKVSELLTELDAIRTELDEARAIVRQQDITMAEHFAGQKVADKLAVRAHIDGLTDAQLYNIAVAVPDFHGHETKAEVAHFVRAALRETVG